MVRRPRVRVISPVVKEKVYGGKDLLKSQVLSSEWNTERVREDASGDSEDGENDEMPCVIGESAGVWRGSRRSVGSSFHRQGAAYLKERFVIFKEEWCGRARVTIERGHRRTLSMPVRKFNLIACPLLQSSWKTPFRVQSWIWTQAGESHQPIRPAGTVAYSVV